MKLTAVQVFLSATLAGATSVTSTSVAVDERASVGDVRSAALLTLPKSAANQALKDTTAMYIGGQSVADGVPVATFLVYPRLRWELRTRKRGRDAAVDGAVDTPSSVTHRTTDATKQVTRPDAVGSTAESTSCSSRSSAPAVLPVVIGNVANWLGPSAPQTSSHVWTVYIRGLHNEDLSPVIESVTFTLHDTFVPNVRVVSQPPFELTERGWGEFLVGLTVKLVDVAAPLELTHMLQFSLRPRLPHCLPPSGRQYQKEEALTPYTLAIDACVYEQYDELVVYNATQLTKSRICSLKAYQGGVRGVSVWNVIRRVGPHLLQPTTAAVPYGLPLTERPDTATLQHIRSQLSQAVAGLQAEVAHSLLASLPLRR